MVASQNEKILAIILRFLLQLSTEQGQEQVAIRKPLIGLAVNQLCACNTQR